MTSQEYPILGMPRRTCTDFRRQSKLGSSIGQAGQDPPDQSKYLRPPPRPAAATHRVNLTTALDHHVQFELNMSGKSPQEFYVDDAAVSHKALRTCARVPHLICWGARNAQQQNSNSADSEHRQLEKNNKKRRGHDYQSRGNAQQGGVKAI